LGRSWLRVFASLIAVVTVTVVARSIVPVNATTVGFAYLLVVLIIASTWGFVEAALSSILATLVFNFFFLPPVGTFTIADPQNWVALFSFLATSLIASRLSAKAKARALEAIERQQDVERLYSFSRAILLIDRTGPFPRQLAEKVVEIFKINTAVLLDRRTDEMYRVGGTSEDDLENHVRAAVAGVDSFRASGADCVVVPILHGTEAVASLGLRGPKMPQSLLNGIANLVAIGLERARAQDLAQQVEAARQSEQLRTTLIDAMAHEFKTPLTLIRAATTSLLANPDRPSDVLNEQLKIADEEAEHLKELIDNAVEMARLDTAHIDVHPEISNLQDAVREVLASMRTEIDERRVRVVCDQLLPAMGFDRRLMKLAIKQLLDNALKYSPSETPVEIALYESNGAITLEVANYGNGIPLEEHGHIFERFYRSPSIKNQIPGSGLGLSIAHSIVQAHNGELSLSSEPGRTAFRITIPALKEEIA
jgi:two-component system, OmpR family, sensor histidine kinase KdpD